MVVVICSVESRPSRFLTHSPAQSSVSDFGGHSPCPAVPLAGMAVLSRASDGRVDAQECTGRSAELFTQATLVKDIAGPRSWGESRAGSGRPGAGC